MTGMYKYFTKEELSCSHCGENKMDEDFVNFVSHLREKCGFPFPVSSGYRCPKHPVEASKSSPGAHTTGKAMDVRVSGKKAYTLLQEATRMGFLGIGINQKGEVGQRFIHIDMWTEGPRPAVWSY